MVNQIIYLLEKIFSILPPLSFTVPSIAWQYLP